MRKDIWETILHPVFWVSAFLLISPRPIGLGEMQMGGMGEVPLSIILIYSLLIDAFIVYSYKRNGLPYYLESPKLKTFVALNLAFLLGFTLLKALLDWLFGSWVAWYVGLESGSGLYHFLQGETGAIVSGEQPATFPEWFMVNLVTTTIILFLANGYGFISDWWKERRIHHKLEREKLAMELSVLKHQINPHFLFNILNGLYAMALKNDDEPTAMGIEKLSRMMRYVLYESNDKLVGLDQEVEYIQNYIDLQGMRMGEKVAIEFRVGGEIKDQRIAPMLFIPFIENAFKHGVSTVRPSFIDISLHLNTNSLDFRVSNSLHPPTTSAHKPYSGIGQENVRKRLDMLYPGQYVLQIEGEKETYSVNLKLDL
jgi:two-component system LytT family sensor kinase